MKHMTERNFISLLLFAAFAVFSLWPSPTTLGGLLVLALLFATHVAVAREKDERIKALRDDVQKQLAPIKDKVDAMLLRGNR